MSVVCVCVSFFILFFILVIRIQIEWMKRNRFELCPAGDWSRWIWNLNDICSQVLRHKFFLFSGNTFLKENSWDILIFQIPIVLKAEWEESSQSIENLNRLKEKIHQLFISNQINRKENCALACKILGMHVETLTAHSIRYSSKCF